MLKKILIGLVVVIVLFVGFVATRPGEWSLARSASINAPPAIVHEHLNDFHEWQGWSPWDNVEGDELKRTFTGPDQGVGATYAWEGKKTGEGEMKITDSKPGEHVGIALKFIKPFEADNVVDFDLVKEGEGTRVTWRMNGKNNFMGKLFGLFADMDKMVGADFEKGLANLKKHAEADAAEAAAAEKKAADEAAAAVPTEAVDAGTP
ncbi:MAG: SRPBCC family protein [Archangium sp.]